MANDERRKMTQGTGHAGAASAVVQLYVFAFVQTQILTPADCRNHKKIDLALDIPQVTFMPLY
jgi:hypothetical protein